MAVFDRGMGLGNRLWPWSRCKIFSRENDAIMLPPQWFHMRSAPFRMGGIDYQKSLRKILLFGNFINNSKVGYLKKQWLLMTKQQVPEEILQKEILDNKIVVFRGYGDFFRTLLVHREFLMHELLQVTNTSDKEQYLSFPAYDIALNIRMGRDFPTRTSLTWYEQMLKQLLSIKPGLKSIIISDGSFHELQLLTRITGVKYLQSRSAILDLLILSKAKLILGEGGSSFTAWGSFLSGAPTIVYKGTQWAYMNLYNVPNGPVLYEADMNTDLTNLKIF